MALACAEAASDKKAEDIVILDMQGISSFTDYFVICSGSSEPQLKAISNGIHERLKQDFGRSPLSEDGYPMSQWLVLDYGDVVVHIFHTEKREYYCLEQLWGDARRVPFEG